MNASDTHNGETNVPNYSIGELCYVHGTVDENLIFGVNDETQISNPAVFDCEDGDIDKKWLIKSSAINLSKSDTITTASKLINDSQIIYIYGMSLGSTDAMWWDKIYTWLKNSDNHHRLIIHYLSLPAHSPVKIKYIKEQQKVKLRFVFNSGHCEPDLNQINNKIIVTDGNIFNLIKDIADPADDKQSLECIYEKLLEI